MMRARPHESAELHVTGSARYTDEVALPAGSLVLWPVLAELAHARIVKIDTRAALNLPGVHAVYTAADIPGSNNTGPILPDEVLLPVTEVMYHSQALAWVLADNDSVAAHAASMVHVEMEALPALLDIDAALAANSVHMSAKLLRRGDAQRALSAAPLRLQGRLENGPQDHFYLETQCSNAYVDADGQLLVHASTQHPSETQHMIAHVLGISNAQVVVRCLRMGGGFGGKETQANAFACMVALAAWKTGRAVRIKLSREYDMKLTGKRHGFRTDWDLGFDHDGRIHAFRATMVSDAGWSCDLSPPVLLRAMVHVDNAYYLPHVDIEGWMAKTHKVSNTAFRGFGGPQGMLIIEDILSHVARHLQLAPELVRLRNFYQSADQLTHYLQPVGEVRIQRIFDELLQSAEFVARRAAIAQHNASHAWRKKGLAITPVKFGISFNKVEYNQAGALVLIYRDGSVQINHGGTEMGQGLHTKMQAVAARSLGIDAQLIRVMTTATDKVPNTSATAASSGADLNGQAVHRACKEILQRMSEVLRAHWTLANDVELTMVDGQIRYQQRSITFVELVELCYSARVSLSATGFYATPGLSFDLSTNTGNPFYYFSWGAAVSEVSIDGYTGEWKLVRADLLHDAGESLNPLIDIGQIEGGFVQGMGWLTMEELVWDSAGKLRTFAPSTYKIPTISEVPTQFHTALLQGAAQPGVIFGSKAVGEPPLMLAISVREALRDAVAAFASNPQQRIELAAPATPEAILRAVDAVR